MKRYLCVFFSITALLVPPFSFAGHGTTVGGFEQMTPESSQGAQDIGAGWGHRSMTYGMMNMMSGMTSQVAAIIRTGKATPEMTDRLASILDHLAGMMNYAPAYMMGTRIVDSDMMEEMQEMLKDLEKMRKETGLR
jgi:hypothetical protein